MVDILSPKAPNFFFRIIPDALCPLGLLYVVTDYRCNDIKNGGITHGLYSWFSQYMLFRSCVTVILNFLVLLKTFGCSGGARRMDSTAFVVGRVDTKFGPGSSIAVNTFCIPRIGVSSPTIGAVLLFPAAPYLQRLEIALFSTNSPPRPWERLHRNLRYPMHPGVSLCPALVCRFAEVRTPHTMN